MGAVYLIVNPVKRQYLNPIAFGETDRYSGFLHGYHALAIARLVCDHGRDYVSDGVAGSWSSDHVLKATDAEAPDATIATASPTVARNLYTVAWDDFTDISARAVAMLCDYGTTTEDPEALTLRVASILVTRAREKLEGSLKKGGVSAALLLRYLGDAAAIERADTLKVALCEQLGSDWKELYSGALQLLKAYE